MAGRSNIKGSKDYDPEYAAEIRKKNLESAGASGPGIYNKEMGEKFAADLRAKLEPHATAIKEEVDPIWKNNSAQPGSAEFVAQMNRTSEIFAARSGQIKADLESFLEEQGLTDSTDLNKIQNAQNDFMTKYASTYGVDSTVLQKKSKTAVETAKSTLNSQEFKDKFNADLAVFKEQTFANIDGLNSISGDLSQKISASTEGLTGNLNFDNLGSKLGDFATKGTTTVGNLLGDITTGEGQFGNVLQDLPNKATNLLNNFDVNSFSDKIPGLPDMSTIPNGIQDVNIENAVFKTTVGNQVVSVTEVKSVIDKNGKTLGTVAKNSGKVFDI